MSEDPKFPFAKASPPHWLALVETKVAGLRYGIVTIVVNDSIVTQIESTERTRVAAKPGAHPSAR
jgi:hypothetical protein